MRKAAKWILGAQAWALGAMVLAPALATAQTPGAAPAAAQNPATPAAETAKRPVMALVSVKPDVSGSAPRACLTFSQPLIAGRTDYGRFLTFGETVKNVGVTVEGTALCLTGLGYNRVYNLTVGAGLPAASGDVTPAAEPTTVTLGDREPMVNFAGGGFILPRNGGGGLTLETINVDAVEIKVLRIGHRLLAPELKRQWNNRELATYQAEELAKERASVVWTGSMAIQHRRNEPQKTQIPFAKLLGERKPGAYLVAVRNQFVNPGEESWAPMAAQWLIETDMALTAYQGGDGLRAQLRALSNAKSLAGRSVQLLAVNNEILGEAKSDADGFVSFPPALLRGTGGDAPAALLAYGPEVDFTLLDLHRPAFDLSDRGVSGRPPAGDADAFLYADRGIYRPGETVRLTALLRDAAGKALGGAPLTLTLMRPNNTEARREVITPAADGGATLDWVLDAAASRGVWRIEARLDPTRPPVGKLTIDVQDFVPQRLKVIATSPATATGLKFDQNAQIDIDGAFLYGAPAADLPTEVDAKIVVDAQPVPNAAGYVFGRHDDPFEPKSLPAPPANADGAGKAKVLIPLGPAPTTTKPLKLQVNAGLVEPSGRVVKEKLAIPLRTASTLLGIKPLFNDNRAAEGVATGLEIQAFAPGGGPVALAGTRWRLIEEEVNYVWRRVEERWTYEVVIRDRLVDEGTATLDGGKPAMINRSFTWGRWRLEAFAPGSNIAVSYRFRAGYGDATAGAETPDTVDVTVDAAKHRVGENARLRILPPAAGEVTVVIASDKIHSTRSLSVGAEGTTLDIPTAAAWGPGAYALVTWVRPTDGPKRRDPVRAVGVAWLGVDASDRTLGVALQAPQASRPRQKLEIGATVTGAKAGESVKLTLAAVDEGVLQLTRHVSPKPEDYFFGKRRLGVELRDDYGKLLEAAEGPVGALRSGGDGLGGAGLPVVPVKTVALFSGVVPVGADGKVAIPFDVPDFNGRLRLMAVAWTGDSVGSSESFVTVRDPVVAELSPPRFLAPGDQGRATLLLHNLEGAPGQWTVKVEGSGPFTIENGARSFELPVDARKIDQIPVTAGRAGIGALALTVTGPDGWSVKREWPLASRPATLPITLEQTALQKPGERFAVDPKIPDLFEPENFSASLSYSALRGVDVPALLGALDRYPYGCSEQLTSRAAPLLSFADPAYLNAPDANSILSRVDRAIAQLAERQDADGNLGLWRAGDDAGSMWLNAYVADFLLRAKAVGRPVSDLVMKTALKQLPYGVNSGLSVAGYAEAVLAKAGRADPGHLRRLHDEQLGGNRSPFAAAQLGYALAMIGDRARSANAFAAARALLGKPAPAYDKENPYASPLRDLFAAAALAAEAGDKATAQSILQAYTPTADLVSQSNTQEKLWILRAAAALNAGDPPKVSFGGLVPASAGAGPGLAMANLNAARIRAGVTADVQADGPLWRSLVVSGSPIAPPPAVSQGLQLEKSFWTADGKPFNPTQMRRNDRVIIKLSGKALDKRERRLVMVDLLPAGWEIEGAVVRDAEGNSRFPFLGHLSTLRTREARDDRFVAAFDVNGEEEEAPNNNQSDKTKPPRDPAAFTLAYVIRAVTPGAFVLPGAAVEDMYRANIMARTGSGRITIGAP